MAELLNSMEAWYQSPIADSLLKDGVRILQDFVAHHRGNYLLQIGGPRDYQLTQLSRIKYKAFVSFSDHLLHADAGIQAHFAELPIVPGSIDLAILPYSIEFVAEPLQLLTELYRCLNSQGQLLILGFNALSLWGCKRLVNCKQGYPWCGQFYTINKVCHWLRRLDLDVVTARTFFFHGPNARWHAKTSRFFEVFGQVCLPWLGGAYLIIAQKRQLGVTPLPAYRFRKHNLPMTNGFAKPAARNYHYEHKGKT